jgi:serine protease Do
VADSAPGVKPIGPLATIISRDVTSQEHSEAAMMICSVVRTSSLHATILSSLCVTALLADAGPSYAQAAKATRSDPKLAAPATSSSLRQLDAALKELTTKVSPAVVQILATGYGLGRENGGQTAVLARQQAVGSGVILDPNGYIITNAHVVKGAERIEVLLTRADGAAQQSFLAATLVGLSEYFDLALLKVEATGLATLQFADFRQFRQGQLVLAIGSPLGLDNSVTMGVISSVARQAKPDSPIVFVQTDAPVNPGNSGGALVDVEGRLVGINTLMISQTGGNEGMGFALPAPIVKLAYQSLREQGHIHRRILGLGIQTITPTLARGLGLPVVSGLIVCDVVPEGPGEKAGVRIGDVVVEAGGGPVNSPPQLDGTLYVHDITQPLSLTVLREGARVALPIQVEEEKHEADSLIDPSDTEKNLVPQLGVLAATVTPEMESTFGELRISTGVLVVALIPGSSGADLLSGDVIHAVRYASVTSLEELRDRLAAFKRGDAVVLLVERGGSLAYVSFEMS